MKERKRGMGIEEKIGKMIDKRGRKREENGGK